MDNQNQNSQISPVEPQTQNASVLNKGLIMGLLVLVVVLLAIVIYLLTAKPVVSPVVDNNQSLLKQEQTVESNKTPIADGMTYQNEKYGFELTLTEAWKGYKVFSYEGSQGVGSPTFLQFAVPTVDKTKCVMQVTDEVCGYVAPFSIMVVNKDTNNVSTVDGKITEDKDRVYYYSTYTHFNALPEDVSKINFEIPKILSTFKFITQNETASWKTYKNEKYGFELTYPSNLVVQENSNSAGLQVWFEQKNEATFFIQIKKAQLTSSVNLSNYFYMDFEPKSQTTLAGQTANVYEAPNGYCDGPGCSNPFVAVVTGKGNDVYILQFNGDIQINSIEQQILNSVKFSK